MAFVRADPLQSIVKDYPLLEANPETSWTALFDNEIVAVGGIAMIWEGVGELWLIMTESSQRHGVFGIIAFNQIKKKIDELLIEQNVVRAQAHIRVEFEKSWRMMEALGFKREATHEKMTPEGTDMYMYVLIRRPNGNQR